VDGVEFDGVIYALEGESPVARAEGWAEGPSPEFSEPVAIPVGAVAAVRSVNLHHLPVSGGELQSVFTIRFNDQLPALLKRVTA